jgi:PUB domain/Ubiquitin family
MSDGLPPDKPTITNQLLEFVIAQAAAMSESMDVVGENAATSNEITVHLTVTALPTQPRIPLVLDATVDTVTTLREKVASATHIPLASLKLIFRGRLIAANAALNLVVPEYKLENGSVLHCMGKPTTTAPAATAAASTATVPAPAPSFSLIPPGVSIPSAAPSSSAATVSAATTPAVPAAEAADLRDPLVVAIQSQAALCANTADFITALTTVNKILLNIINHPLELKYRQLKQSNPALQRKLAGLSDAPHLFRLLGFAVTTLPDQGPEVYYVLNASAEAWPQLVQNQGLVERLLQRMEQANTPALPWAAAPAAAGLSPDPERSQVMEMLMSNPQMMQSMMQVSWNSYARAHARDTSWLLFTFSFSSWPLGSCSRRVSF